MDKIDGTCDGPNKKVSSKQRCCVQAYKKEPRRDRNQVSFPKSDTGSLSI